MPASWFWDFGDSWRLEWKLRKLARSQFCVRSKGRKNSPDSCRWLRFPNQVETRILCRKFKLRREARGNICLNPVGNRKDAAEEWRKRVHHPPPGCMCFAKKDVWGRKWMESSVGMPLWLRLRPPAAFIHPIRQTPSYLEEYIFFNFRGLREGEDATTTRLRGKVTFEHKCN